MDQFDGVLLAGIDYTGGAVKPDGGLSQAINAIRSDKRLMFPAWKINANVDLYAYGRSDAILLSFTVHPMLSAG